jgi:quercetin dioxygenase-like cupin family protein
MPSPYFLTSAECKTHHPFPGVTMRTTQGERMTLSVVEMEPGALIPVHSHPHEQVGRMLEGKAEFIVGNEKRLVTTGEMWRIPGGVPHQVTALDEPVKALDAFYPIRDDYR